MIKNIDLSSKMCCFIIAILPIMQLYGFSFFPLLTFADYLLLLLIVISLYKTNSLNNLYCLGLVVYLLIQPLFVLCTTTNLAVDNIDMIGTAWRLAFYVMSICFLSKEIISLRGLQWAFRIVGSINVVYAVLQYTLGTFLKISLTPYLPFLPIVRAGLEEQQIGWINYGWTVRARGFFAEPSHIAIYMLLALAIELFSARKNKLFICGYAIGIAVSYSSTGFVALIFLFIYFIFVNQRNIFTQITGRKLLVGGGVIVICCVIFAFSGYLTDVIDHIFANGKGITSQSHFADIEETLRQPTTFLEFIFGHGLQEVVTGYVPGWIGSYYCLGVIGVIIYLFVFITLIRKTNKYGRGVLLLFIFLNVGTEIMLGIYLVLYIAVAIRFSESAEVTRKCFIIERSLYARDVATFNS